MAQAFDDADRQVDLQSPELPAAIRQAALAQWSPGDSLWRCPRLSARQGALGWLGFGQQRVVIEWWHIDADGELVEAYWQAD